MKDTGHQLLTRITQKDCGCEYGVSLETNPDDPAFWLTFCPTHQAAPLLLEQAEAQLKRREEESERQVQQLGKLDLRIRELESQLTGRPPRWWRFFFGE